MERNPEVDWAARRRRDLSAAPTRPARTTATWRAWRCCSRGCRSTVPGVNVNRLCGSGIDAVANARRAPSGPARPTLMIAGGVESMSRAPVRDGQGRDAPSRAQCEIYDTTIGWRFVNPLMKAAARRRLDARDGRERRGASTASRARPGRFRRARQQTRAKAAQRGGRLAAEIVPVDDSAARRRSASCRRDEHPRADTTLETLAQAARRLSATDGTVTAGNASGVNDGACALLVASRGGGEEPRPARRARASVARATAGVPPRIMGMGPVPATRKLLARARPEARRHAT